MRDASKACCTLAASKREFCYEIFAEGGFCREHEAKERAPQLAGWCEC